MVSTVWRSQVDDLLVLAISLLPDLTARFRRCAFYHIAKRRLFAVPQTDKRHWAGW